MLTDGMEYIYTVPSQTLKQAQAIRRRRIIGAGSEGAFLDELGESRALAHVGPLVNETPFPSASPRKQPFPFSFSRRRGGYWKGTINKPVAGSYLLSPTSAVRPHTPNPPLRPVRPRVSPC